MNVATGTYTGNGTGQSISGLGFSPDVVIIKRSTAVAGVLSCPQLQVATSEGLLLDGSGTVDSASITSLDADGFTVGTSDKTNFLTGTYYWVAFDESVGECKILTWTGDDTNNRAINGAGFQPDFAIGADLGGFPLTSKWLGQTTGYFPTPIAAAATFGRISAFLADGIEVGNDFNSSAGSGYFAICLKAVAGNIAVESYVGDGNDDRSISGFDMSPDFAMVKENGTGDLCLKYQDHPAGESCFCVAANAVNLIQALEADGIQVGNGADINDSGITYFALGLSPVAAPAGQPGRFFFA